MVDGEKICHYSFVHLTNYLSISLFTRLEAGSLLVVLIGEVRWDGDIPSIVLMTGLLGPTGVLLEVPVAKNGEPIFPHQPCNKFSMGKTVGQTRNNRKITGHLLTFSLLP